MRADIHDGREHNTLQSEAGYIDARPHIRARSTKPSCNARPDHTLGQSRRGRLLPAGGRLPQCPESGRKFKELASVAKGQEPTQPLPPVV